MARRDWHGALAFPLALALGLGASCDQVEPADVASAVITTSDGAVTGTFTTLTYNVAGLLEPFSSSHPATNTPQISCKIRSYDLVNVQEDFNYHAALYDSCDDHPYRSSTSGGMGIGDGLNVLSRFPLYDFLRVTWKQRVHSDALTPKGFTVARVRLADGVFLDVYNLHAQSETDDAALSASRADMDALLSFIEAQSAGNAVLVMGDFNARYTRPGQNVGDLLRHGFHDVWIDLIRGGVAPAYTSAVLTSCASATHPDCEIVDKVLYRSSRQLTLVPTEYEVDSHGFVDASGAQLSDHLPVRVSWQFRAAPAWRLADLWGGPHGDAFNDLGVLPDDAEVSGVTLRTGARVDRVGVQLGNGFALEHGGQGGSAQSLALGSGELLTGAQLCSGQRSGHTRIFYAKLSTSQGRTLAGGAMTGDCASYSAPAGWHIVGFHGRSGDEIDELAPIYARVRASRPTAPRYLQLINARSNLCLDIVGARAANGNAVAQWTCNGGTWQRWYHEPATGLLHSQLDARFCLEASSVVGDGASVLLSTCSGAAGQEFDLDAASGTVRSRANPRLVLDDYQNGTEPGAAVVLWTGSGSANQSWSLVP